MTRRDLAWRASGAALFAAACALGLSSRFGAPYGIGILGFGAALLGLVLLVEGKRVPAALRVERGRHRALARAIRERRTRRSRDGGR